MWVLKKQGFILVYKAESKFKMASLILLCVITGEEHVPSSVPVLTPGHAPTPALPRPLCGWHCCLSMCHQRRHCQQISEGKRADLILLLEEHRPYVDKMRFETLWWFLWLFTFVMNQQEACLSLSEPISVCVSGCRACGEVKQQLGLFPQWPAVSHGQRLCFQPHPLIL